MTQNSTLPGPSPVTLGPLLDAMLQKGASDLHLKVGSAPGFRVDGAMTTDPGHPALRPIDTYSIALEILAEERRPELDTASDLEASYTVSGIARYRCSIFRQRDTVSIALRRIPVEIPDIDRLGLPLVAKRFSLLPRGLVLVTGPTGSGKSTTLAAMVDYLNREAPGHIVTFEDPIEFLHRDKKCFISQREIGTDCESFNQGLRRALRQDPDVIMIGELRDLETISLAMSAAETGHLVFATLHTTGAVQSVDRILDAFPTESRSSVRIQLSNILQGVISQTLLAKIGGGRAAAFEVLVGTEAVRNCIREEKTHQITSLIQTGASQGMQTLDSALADLVAGGIVSELSALAKANHPEWFRQTLAAGGSPLRANTRAQSPETRKAAPLPQEPVAPEPTRSIPSDILEKLRRS